MRFLSLLSIFILLFSSSYATDSRLSLPQNFVPVSQHSVVRTDKNVLSSSTVSKTSVISQRYHQTGLASFYGPGFWGHKTASGKRMLPRDMTAAHISLPLGTVIKVTNQHNGRSVIVCVNDRGPYVKHRIIDLAEKPARLLDMKHSGVTSVSIDVVEVAEYSPPK